jgi:hypothetical protein
LAVAVEVARSTARDLTLAFDARALRIREDAARAACILIDPTIAIIIDPVAEFQAAFQARCRDAGIVRAEATTPETVERTTVARRWLVRSALRACQIRVVTIAAPSGGETDDQGEDDAATRGVHDDHVVWLRSKVSRQR